MARRPNPLGETGNNLAQNLRFYRRSRGYSFRTLQDRLKASGYSISHTALGNIEAGKRRVEVDDLRALADVFGIGVLALLLPGNVPTTEALPATPTSSDSAERQTIERLVAHDRGFWPKYVPRPANDDGDMERLAAYFFDSSLDIVLKRRRDQNRKPTTLYVNHQGRADTYLHFASGSALLAQEEAIEDQLAQQTEELETLKQIHSYRRPSNEVTQDLARLWWELRRGGGRAERTLQTGTEELRRIARELDDRNLQLFTDMNAHFVISFQEIDGATRPCTADGTPLSEQ